MSLKHSHRLRYAFYLITYLSDVPKQRSSCTPYVTHCLPNGFVWRQFQLDHCASNAQNDSQYGGCVRTVKPAGRSLIGIRHFSSNRENPEKHYWRLAAAPRILSQPTVLRKTNVLTKRASCCIFNIWTSQTSLKKMAQTNHEHDTADHPVSAFNFLPSKHQHGGRTIGKGRLI